MRLELTAPVTTDLQATGEDRRIVAGLAVPWNVTARLANGRRARFLPGSLEASEQWLRNPLLLLHHDRTAPIGILREARDTGDGMHVRAYVSDTIAGTEALTLAADGVLRGLSVGVEATDFTEDADDDPADPVIVVAAGKWNELSLVAWGAYDEAGVDYVAASAPEPDEPDDDEPEPDDPDDDQPLGDDVTDTLDAAAPVPVLASRPTLTATHPAPITLRGIAREVCEAARAAGPGQRHDAVEPVLARHNLEAQRRASLVLEAALDDVLTPSGTSGVIGLIRPSYENEVVGIIQFGAPVVAAFLQGNLDSSPVTYPKWTTLPTVGTQATQKTEIASGPVRIDPATATVATIAGGNDVAMQVIDWSSPDFIAEYFRAATEVYARYIDDIMLDLIVAGATDLEESGDGIGADLGAAIGLVASTGLPPDRIIVSGDVFGQLWGANVGITSGGISQVLGIDLPVPRVVLAPLAAAGTFIVTSSRVAKSWQNRGAPVQLRAVNVGLLGVDLGVYGYFASAIVQGAATANPAIQSIVPATP